MNIESNPDGSLLLTVEETAAVLTVSPRTIWKWIADGSLRAIRLSKRLTRIKRGDALALIEQRTSVVGGK
jgi:excisionase family DNA binding protein